MKLKKFQACSGHVTVAYVSTSSGPTGARRTPFSNVVRMRTRSLVPKPKTTVIGLGARLVDT